MSSVFALRDALRQSLPSELTRNAGNAQEAAVDDAIRFACQEVSDAAVENLSASTSARAALASVLATRGSGSASVAAESLEPFRVNQKEAKRLWRWGGIVDRMLEKSGGGPDQPFLVSEEKESGSTDTGYPAPQLSFDALDVSVADLVSAADAELGRRPLAIPPLVLLAAELNVDPNLSLGEDLLGGIAPRRALVGDDRDESSMLRAHFGRLPGDEQKRVPSTSEGVGWGRFLLTKVAEVVLSPLSSPAAKRVPDERYVLLSAVRRRSHQVIETVFERLNASDRDPILMDDAVVVTEDEVVEALKECARDDVKKEFGYVRPYLVRSGLAAEFEVDGKGRCFKLARPGSTSKLSVDHTDRAVIVLRTTLEKLRSQQQRIVGQIEKAQQEALKHHRASNVKLALHEMRRKKRLEEILDSRVRSENQLREVSDGIVGGLTAAQVVSALRDGNLALKGIHRRHDLSAETVDDVMLDIGETLSDQREIDEAMAQGVGGSLDADFDEDELNAELEALVAPPVAAAQRYPDQQGAKEPAGAEGVAEASVDALVQGMADLSIPTDTPEREPQAREPRMAALA
jgi:Snf7